MGGVGEGGVRRRLRQQPGDHAVGHLRKDAMDFLLQVGEATRGLLQRLEPFFRIGLQALMNLGQNGCRRR